MTERESHSSSSNRRPRLQLTNWQIILIALVIVGGRLVIDFSQRIVEGQQKISEQRALEAQLQALVDEQKALEAAKTYYSSPSFVEAWAHDEGKMVREGEVLVIPVYEGEDAAPSATIDQTSETAPTAAPLSPWQVWWSLFFDTVPVTELPTP